LPPACDTVKVMTLGARTLSVDGTFAPVASCAGSARIIIAGVPSVK
jgi:hypothetical protein